LASLAGAQDEDRFNTLFNTGPIVCFSLGGAAAALAMGLTYIVTGMHGILTDRYMVNNFIG